MSARSRSTAGPAATCATTPGRCSTASASRTTLVDIESDDELFKRYLERIPVVAVDGEEAFDFFVDEATLLRARLQ